MRGVLPVLDFQYAYAPLLLEDHLIRGAFFHFSDVHVTQKFVLVDFLAKR